ncbi:MAG: 8-amino-7-oxononanoate synthase [Rickettsiales bacterium]|nr:8-amino-7-oxononanoate synthase [Rickettsiales bacterium]
MNKIYSNNKKNNKKLVNIDYSSRIKDKGFDYLNVNGKQLYNFSSNDYLGLSKKSELIKSSNIWTNKYGTSLSSSRLISGNLDQIRDIEDLISKFTFSERTLILGSGFLLNLTLIPTLTGNYIGSREKFYIFSDKLNHSSINYGCYLTRQKVIRYNHNDLNHLEYLLEKAEQKIPKIIITETLFSMDGDLIDVNGFRSVAKKYNALLYFDEAHSMGVFGKKGFGLTSDKKKYDNEIVVGTFGKAFGSYGAFVTCSEKLSKKIINLCSGLIYSTVLPPSVLGTICKSVEMMPKLDSLRIKLLENSYYLRRKLKELSINTGESNSQIIPIILGNYKKCNQLSEFLKKNNYFVKTIQSPTVPKVSERIRISLTATMNKKMLSKLVSLISRVDFL